MPRGNGSARREYLVKGRSEALARRLGQAGASVSELPALADCAGVVAAIDAVTGAGAAITFATTRDRGTYSITIMEDGTYTKHYKRTEAELIALFQALCEVYNDEAGGV